MSVEGFSSIAVTAETHPPGYSFHKYWARKPHNVVRRALRACGVKDGDIVIDPFCGSGVPLSEAAALSASCIGFDVNPIAVELTRATLCPPNSGRFGHAFASLLDEAERELAHLFLVDGRPIRYAVHATVVECDSCKARVAADAASKRGRSYVCPLCKSRLHCNLENLVATRVSRIVFEDGSQAMRDEEVDERSCADHGAIESAPFDHAIEHNARILAFRGMRTRHLFTRRNFLALAHVARRITDLPAELRGAASLTLTAAVAQCSRLVAYRNDLTTGGPAWTVPGFWVPPVHLETNPLIHLRARLQRTCKGLEHLEGLPGRGAKHVIRRGDGGRLAAELSKGERAAVVFLDPPYGDSVPYLEFSAMWNGFLGLAPDPALDIAVSDRSRGDGSWEAYEASLSRIVAAVRAVLRDDGRILVTFNNKDLRAWKALLSALQGAALRCAGAFYQHPAVVSAKAQLARDGSYVGDLYCVFVPSTIRPSSDVAPIAAAVREAISADRRTVLDEDALRRVAVTELLRANVDAACLDAIDGIIERAELDASGAAARPPRPKESGPRFRDPA